MAGPLLKRANAIVWLPPRGDGRTLLAADTRLLAFARGAGNAWSATYASIEALAARKSVVLMVDARDVTLLAPKLPPLTGARLVRALPNVIEDMLLQDPAACVLALGPQVAGSNGARLVAACDRLWLENAVAAFERRGLSVSAIWPAVLSLPLAAGGWTLACAHDGLALRRSELDAIGWPAGADAQQRIDAIEALLTAAATSGAAELPPLRVLIEDDSWRAPVARALARLRRDAVAVEPLAVPVPAPIDLLPPLRGKMRAALLTRMDWRVWRWPLGLATACALAFLVGLNLHWARLAREHTALRATLEQTFRQVMPGNTAMVDPVLQIRRHVASLRTQGGASAPDDFVPLLTRFSQALGAGANDAIASVDYRDGALRVRLRPGRLDTDAARDALREACTQAGLTVRFEAGRDPLAIVQVRA